MKALWTSTDMHCFLTCVEGASMIPCLYGIVNQIPLHSTPIVTYIHIRVEETTSGGNVVS